MGGSPLGPPTPKLSHLQAEPAHLPQHPILGGLRRSCSRPLWCQGSKIRMRMSSNHPLRRRGARWPQDRDGWNEFQSHGETTGLQPQLRLLGLCNFCPRFPAPVAAGRPDPGANRLPWDFGRMGQFGKQVPPDRAVSGGEGDTRGEHWVPRARVCFPKRLHLTQNQTHAALPDASAAPPPSLPAASRLLSLN